MIKALEQKPLSDEEDEDNDEAMNVDIEGKLGITIENCVRCRRSC